MRITARLCRKVNFTRFGQDGVTADIGSQNILDVKLWCVTLLYCGGAMMSQLFERRTVLGAGAGLIASGCTPCARLKSLPPTDARLPLGDSHVHLFNAADLPVTGFFRHVVIPEDLSGVPEIGAAMLDIATRILKVFSRSANDELRELKAPWRSIADHMSPERFADEVGELADAAMRARPIAANRVPDPVDDLGDSYAALAALLDAVKGGAGSASARVTHASPDRIDRAFLARVASEGAAAAEPQASRTLAGGGADFALSVIQWAFKMVQSRCGHVRDYLENMGSFTTKTTLILNLLVDYDCWLDDRPAAGSEPEAQLRFWTSYARAADRRVTIRTFAGYDPLAHAEQLIDGRTDYFEALAEWVAAGEEAEVKADGFKLYPPMGFNVDANAPLTATGRAADAVRRRWDADRRDLTGFAGGLDRALDLFFAYCVDKNIPMVAHGRESEGSYEGASANAHPRHWLARAKRLAAGTHRHPLRVSLAHYTSTDTSMQASMR